MSLRLRLTLLYIALLGSTLLVFGVLVYGLVSLVSLYQIDNTLAQQSDLLIKYLKVSGADQFDSRYFTGYQPTDTTLLYQVWGNNHDLQLARPQGWSAALDDRGLRATRPVFNSDYSQSVHLRVLSIPVETPHGPVGVVQMALGLSLVDATQEALLTVLVVLSLITMTIAGVISWVSTGQALAPLSWATEVATQIMRADDLARRIPYNGNGNDEVGRLILAFNETLSRLEGLFTTQRRFIADVSHELRTPLTVIKGEVSLMRKIGELDEESLRSVEGEVDRLTRMVGDLLILAQAESGRLPMNLKPVELDTVLLEVFQQMKTLAGERISIKITEIDQAQVIADRDRIKQVLLNLAGNAIQYTQPGGQVTFTLQKVATRARITINDNGPGIPAQDLPHIFERFYRGERSRKRASGSQNSGFGLGLSIAYWIIHNLNGNIEVDSKENQGTTFFVWLPLHDPSPLSPTLAETTSNLKR
jgi:two-component system, OmpR family, sensor kinase